MAGSCTICRHPDRAAIDAALLAGEPHRAIAQRHGVGEDACFRHRQHIAAGLVEAKAGEQARQALDVVAQLKAVNAATLAVLKEARAAGDGDLVLRAVDRVQRQIELQAKLLGQLDERPQVNVLVSPTWITVRAALLTALQPFPEARAAAAAALLTAEASS